jgi:hypothetical protein
MSARNAGQTSRSAAHLHDTMQANKTGRSSVWQSAWFGTRRPQVQILSPRFLARRAKNRAEEM